jgi:hypothetical protein
MRACKAVPFRDGEKTWFQYQTVRLKHLLLTEGCFKLRNCYTEEVSKDMSEMYDFIFDVWGMEEFSRCIENFQKAVQL